MNYTYTPPNPPPTGRVLVIRERFESENEAERKAKRLCEKEFKGVEHKHKHFGRRSDQCIAKCHDKKFRRI